jgi:predicted small metal-binding protein
MTLRWACLEAGCSAVVTAGGEDELIEKVNDHVAEAHASYELEDVILANAEEVDDGRD